MEGILFSNLCEIVKNREVVSEKQSHTVWGIMPYETAEVQGHALVTTENGDPGEVVFSPNLTGWHKIYLSAIDMSSGIFFQAKLDNEDQFTFISDFRGNLGPRAWYAFDLVREMYFCCADLTGRDVIVRKFADRSGITAITWLRCVPMSEAEIEDYKRIWSADAPRNMHVHYDNNLDYGYGIDTKEQLTLGYAPLRRSHVKICSQEVYYSDPDDAVFDENCRCLSTRHSDLAHVKGVKIAENNERMVKTRAEYLHRIGVQFYAAYRASMANLVTPWEPHARYSFISDHPEYYIKTRDGRAVTICSYAYPEARRYAIGCLKRLVERGYDGLSLVMHRGMHVGFEQPVLDAFAQRYDGLDARRVPMDDPRLNDVWCDFVTQFVRELRAELDASFDRRIPINVITGHSPEISRRVGVDIEALCREGLIDHFCAETMATYEKLEDCLAEDGLIDLEKYKLQLGKRYVVLRRYANDRENVEKGTPQFVAIAEKYGVEFFAGMDPGFTSAKNLVGWIEMQKKLGAKNISFFNYFESIRSTEIVNAVSMTACDSIDPDIYTPNFYRLMTLDGYDVSTYLPHWRS